MTLMYAQPDSPQAWDEETAQPASHDAPLTRLTLHASSLF